MDTHTIVEYRREDKTNRGLKDELMIVGYWNSL